MGQQSHFKNILQSESLVKVSYVVTEILAKHENFSGR
jgi:hypothetical protein